MVGIEINAKMREKGQVVIPKPIRDQFGLKLGTDIVFEVDNDDIKIRKKKDDLEILQEFIDAFKGYNFKIPKDHDWNKDYDEEMEERWKKFT